jgi:hypothetical protein
MDRNGLPFFKISACGEIQQAGGHSTLLSPIRIYKEPIKLTTHDVLDRTIVSAAIVFNMALVYHTYGMQPFNRYSTGVLSIAKALYTKCDGLMSCIGNVEAPSGLTAALCDLLSMAMMNNLAQLSLLSMEYEDCSRYLHNLAQRVASSNTDRYDDDFAANVIEVQKEIFQNNAVASMRVSHYAAPVA